MAPPWWSAAETFTAFPWAQKGFLVTPGGDTRLSCRPRHLWPILLEGEVLPHADEAVVIFVAYDCLLSPVLSPGLLLRGDGGGPVPPYTHHGRLPTRLAALEALVSDGCRTHVPAPDPHMGPSPRRRRHIAHRDTQTLLSVGAPSPKSVQGLSFLAG